MRNGTTTPTTTKRAPQLQAHRNARRQAAPTKLTHAHTSTCTHIRTRVRVRALSWLTHICTCVRVRALPWLSQRAPNPPCLGQRAPHPPLLLFLLLLSSLLCFSCFLLLLFLGKCRRLVQRVSLLSSGSIVRLVFVHTQSWKSMH